MSSLVESPDNPSAVPHTITLHTADVDKSGTDGNLIVKFFGDNGTSDDVSGLHSNFVFVN